ncbi:MAG: hypothetical protein ABJA71_09680 [Ginsengibacter sp.]
MDLQGFKDSLSGAQPPGNVSEYIKGLWYDANGNWDQAHKLIQDIKDAKAAWIHAYLHRKEAIFLMQITGTAELEKTGLLLAWKWNGNRL